MPVSLLILEISKSNMEVFSILLRLRRFPSVLLPQPWLMPPNESQYVREQLPRYVEFVLPPAALGHHAPRRFGVCMGGERAFERVSGDTFCISARRRRRPAAVRVCSSSQTIVQNHRGGQPSA
jgi:hypothetical protein